MRLPVTSATQIDDITAPARHVTAHMAMFDLIQGLITFLPVSDPEFGLFHLLNDKYINAFWASSEPGLDFIALSSCWSLFQGNFHQ